MASARALAMREATEMTWHQHGEGSAGQQTPPASPGTCTAYGSPCRPPVSPSRFSWAGTPQLTAGALFGNVSPAPTLPLPGEGRPPRLPEASGLEDLRQLTEELQVQIGFMREELACVRECLVASKLISKQAIQAQLHRLRFERMRRDHPIRHRSGDGLEEGACLEDVLTVQELALAVARSGGPLAMRALCAASNAVGMAANGALPSMNVMGTGNIFVCGGYDGSRFLSRVDCFEVAAGAWQSLPPMTARREAAAAAVVGGQLFVCGGFNGSRRLSEVECWDPDTGSWQQLPPMLYRRVGATAAALGSELYVCGGFDGSQYLNTVEHLDVGAGAGRWELLPQMLVAREGAAAAVLRNCLYVFGGNDGAQTLNAAERLDTARRDRWESLPPMSSRRDGAAAGAARGRLYVCGGFDGEHSLSSRSAERFDPGTLTWKTIRPMLARRAGAAAAVVAGHLYVCGGYDGAQNLAECERLDPSLGMWEPLPAMRCRRGYAVGAAS